MPIYRFLIYSNDSIHGIRLRKLIKKLANEFDPKIAGETKNLENEHEVEVLCKVENNGQLASFVKTIIKSAKELADVELKIDEPIDANAIEQWKKFTEFTIIRGDSLKEIELEIEGAERLFRKLQENFKTFLIKRENIKLKGLDYSLKKIGGNLTRDKPKTKWQIGRNEISDLMAEPFNEDLFQSLQEIDQLLDELEEFKGQEINKLPKDKTDELLRLIEISRKKIEELHRKNALDTHIN